MYRRQINYRLRTDQDSAPPGLEITTGNIRYTLLCGYPPFYGRTDQEAVPEIPFHSRAD